MSISFRSSIGRCAGVIHPVSLRHYYFAGATATGLSSRTRLQTPLQQGVSVEDWLAAHPRIRDSILWEHEGFLGLGSASSSYHEWRDTPRSSLQRLVDLYAGCGSPTLADPPLNRVALRDHDVVRMRYSNVDAFRWYLALLAQTLVVEMGQWMPWSLEDYSDEAMRALLDSRSLFSWQLGDSYEMLFSVHAPSVPAESRYTYEFLYRNDLIGTNRVDTIVRLVDWCRWQLRHFNSHEVAPDEYVGGDYTTLSMDLHWQYRGFPPVRRIIDQTTRSVTGATEHWTGGCHGTVGFLRSVLRAVNIPVLYLRQCDHALPHFLHENLYLSHGDDPYSQCARREDLPARALLLDQERYDSYFNSGGDGCDNIGRGVRDATAGLPVLPGLPAGCFGS